jgi:hypothetical protein
MRARTGTSLRALASPVSVASLVLLVLNDHLLKQAWPGVVTGKLSDVAGLVVAPLLLTVGLAAVGVPRPSGWACGLTAVGFTTVKVSPAAATAVSGWWSLTGFPTTMRADPTDLLALPAVYVAWRVHRQVDRQRTVEWRRVVATSTGVALVPFAVIATAATSCDEREGVDRAWVAGGEWASAPTGLGFRLVMHIDGDSIVSIDEVGALVSLPQADAGRLRGDKGYRSIGCDDAGSCWRVGESDHPEIEVSTDDGLTWRTEFSMTVKEADDAAEGVDGGCGGDPSTRLVDLAVLPGDDGSQVVVAAKYGGVLLRSPSGEWARISYEALTDLDAPDVPEGPRGIIGAVHVELPPGYPSPGAPSPGAPNPGAPTAPPNPPCPSPSRRTVTPNPSNGPPTSYDVCP